MWKNDQYSPLRNTGDVSTNVTETTHLGNSSAFLSVNFMLKETTTSFYSHTGSCRCWSHQSQSHVPNHKGEPAYSFLSLCNRYKNSDCSSEAVCGYECHFLSISAFKKCFIRLNNHIPPMVLSLTLLTWI